jgi:lipopolysaccharide transport system permease protein
VIGHSLRHTPQGIGPAQWTVSGSTRSALQAGVELAWTLIRTDFKARYHGSLNGFAWALLRPACMFIVLMTVFSFLFPSPGYKLNLIIGLCLWEFFADATKTGLIALDAKAFLIKKVRSPLWVLVLASLANALLSFSVFAAGIVTYLVVSGRPPSLLHVACFGAYTLALMLIVGAFTMAGSVLFLRVRDLNQVWDVVVQAGFFLAPVVYPLGIVPERFHVYFYLWPPTPIVEFSRAVLVTGATPSITAHVYLAIEVLACLAIGILVFRRYAPRAPEYV